MKEERGSAWLHRHAGLLRKLKQDWDWNKDRQRSFVFVGRPQLAFNPPVLKENLQSSKGWLAKRYYSFEDLFNPWGAIK
jgi:hypothetical protein